MAKNRVRYQEALKRGSAYNEAEMWKEAFGLYRIAISEFPQQPEPYAGLGEACFGMKKLDKALECYKMAARYSRGDISYLRRVADIQERLGQLGAAGRTYMAVGEIYLRGRKLEEAISSWQRAIRIEPHLLGTHRRLAMVYQRQDRTRDAVREYLAIARILQMQGDKKKAIQMCQAALRLDPTNEDVLKAFELIRGGPEAFADEEEEEEEEVVEPTKESDDLSGLVRQMAGIFEAERQSQPVAQSKSTDDPLAAARRLAQNQLADEIFREEEGDESFGGLSKLERDALIGQGMDFESRGQIDDAITCYEKAIKGGLKMAAAHFTLGLLYLDKKNSGKAREALQAAAQDPAYREASQTAMSLA